MKLVILAAAIIIAKSISDPSFFEEKTTNIILICIAVGIWEAYDYHKQNKKQ